MSEEAENSGKHCKQEAERSPINEAHNKIRQEEQPIVKFCAKCLTISLPSLECHAHDWFSEKKQVAEVGFWRL